MSFWRLEDLDLRDRDALLPLNLSTELQAKNNFREGNLSSGGVLCPFLLNLSRIFVNTNKKYEYHHFVSFL